MNKFFCWPLTVLLSMILFSCAQSVQKVGPWQMQVKQHQSEDSFYEVRLEFPEFSCPPESPGCGASFLNEKILTLVNSFWSDFKGDELELKKRFMQENSSEGDEDLERKFTLEINQEVFETGPYISILFQINRYELGAHGNLLYRSMVFDRRTKAFLGVEDIIVDFHLNKDQLNILLTEKLAQVDPCFDRNVSINKEFESFSMSSEGIQFHFEPYELGAYVCGPVTLVATKEELKDLGLWGLGL